MASTTLKPLLKKLKADSPLDEIIKAAASQAIEQAKAEGKGFIGQSLAAEKARERTKEEFRVATKGIKGDKRKILGMLGIDAGGWLDEFEKKASEEEVAEARKKFGLDKKEKKGGPGNIAKPLSLILRNTIQINKTVSQIAKVLSKPSLKSGYTFDPRLGSSGRYVDEKTKRIVSAEKALETGKQRTAALTAAIQADEQPLVKLKEFLEEKLKDFDPVRLQGSIDSAKFSLNGLTPTLGALSVHDKLNMLLAKEGLDSLDTPDRRNRRKPQSRKTKKPGRLGKISRLIRGVGFGGAIAGAGAVAAVGAGAYALNEGMTKAGEESKGQMDVLESKYNLKTVYEKGRAVGYEVRGKKYNLNDLPQEYKDLIEAYGPGDKRSFSAREALKRIRENPERYKALEVGAAGAAPVTPIQPEVATVAPPTPAVTTSTPTAIPGGSVVSSVSAVSTAAPAVALAPSAPPREEKPTSSAVPTIASTGNAPPLEQVTTKAPGVDISGIAPGFDDRMALMAEKFEEVTGKTLMITSAYRSDQKQLELWNKKVAEVKSQHPDWTDEQVTRAVRKWVALPMALGGRGSAHIRGIGIDVNSKGAAGIEAIDGMTVDGQRVSTDQFLAKFGLARPLAHEPWHIQPAGAAPLPDNPDPSSKPLVADAKGNAVSLESGKPVAMSAEAKAAAETPLPPVSPISPEPASPSMVAQSTPAASEAIVATSTPASITPAAVAPQITPAQNQAGQMLAQGSDQLATSQMVAQNAPAPAPVVINQGGGAAAQQPITPPKNPLPKASTRSSESSFNRALAKDFSHPSAFTTATMI